MKSAKLATAAFVSFVVLGCNDPSNPTNPPIPGTLPNGPTLPSLTGPNVLPMTVDGSLCSNSMYPNKPCVSVTVCTPGTSTCTTINDILLDTGSWGLRVFKSVLGSVSPTQLTTGSSDLAECVEFGDGSADWGPVQVADVVLGGESPVSVPIQVIDSTFFSGHYSCGTTVDASPAAAGFNGILGVGLFAQDCGVDCVTSALNGRYFACSGSSCAGASVSLVDQVQNPVPLLPLDNNGVILELPSASADGAASANGYLVLGIGTSTNNVPSGVTAFTADPATGNFQTTYEGNNYASFLDSGSNGLFFPDTQISVCSSGTAAGWFCPAESTNLSATNLPDSGPATSLVQFQIANAQSLLTSGNLVFLNLGAQSPGGLSGTFDWGLPFYVGRNVYVGTEGTTSNLGPGPYWAY